MNNSKSTRIMRSIVGYLIPWGGMVPFVIWVICIYLYNGIITHYNKTNITTLIPSFLGILSFIYCYYLYSRLIDLERIERYGTDKLITELVAKSKDNEEFLISWKKLFKISLGVSIVCIIVFFIFIGLMDTIRFEKPRFVLFALLIPFLLLFTIAITIVISYAGIKIRLASLSDKVEAKWLVTHITDNKIKSRLLEKILLSFFIFIVGTIYLLLLVILNLRAMFGI